MLVNRVSPPRNLSSIRQMVDGFPPAWRDQPALKMKRGDSYWTVTYAELSEHASALGNALLGMGVGPGARVGLISENRSEWVITYLAVTCVGAVIVPYDILLKSDELAAIMRASEARIVFTSAEYLEKVTKAGAAAGTLETIALFDAGAQSAAPAGRWSYTAFATLLEKGRADRAAGRDRYAAASIAPDSLAALIFTSGTTGVPKGVMLSHRNLVENGDGVQQSTVLGPGDNWIIVLPFHHTYPTTMGIFIPLLTGGMITSVPSMKTNVLINTMKETGATDIPAIPLLIEKIYKGILTNVKARPPVVRALFRVMFGLSRFAFKAFELRLGKLLFKSVARELGLEKLRFFISGGRPDRQGDHRRHGGPGPEHLPGLRAHGDIAGHLGDLPRPQQARIGGASPRERAGAHRQPRRERQRRDRRARPRGHARLPRHARKDARGARPRRLAAHRRPRAGRTRTATCTSPVG